MLNYILFITVSNITCITESILVIISELSNLILKKLNWNAQDLDVQESDCYGNTLHIAASRSHIRLLKYLLDLGMDVNRGEKDSNWTPLIPLTAQNETPIKLIFTRLAN